MILRVSLTPCNNIDAWSCSYARSWSFISCWSFSSSKSSSSASILKNQVIWKKCHLFVEKNRTLFFFKIVFMFTIVLTSRNMYCYCLHFLNRIQAKNIKAGRQYVCSSITQQQTIIIYLSNNNKINYLLTI